MAVVLSIAAVNLFQLQRHGVSVVGGLPQGFPPLTVPSVKVSDLPLLVGGAFGIALVSLADTIATASAFAARSGDEIDGNQEMLGIGAANIAAGFFQGFPVSTSGSRTAVAEQAGAKTQVTGLVGALAIAVMLLFFPGLLRDLPQPMLAAVVISASLSLADIPGVIRLWQQRRTEFVLSITAFLGVALLGVLPGIVVAVGLSVGKRVPALVVAVPDDPRAGRGPARVPRRAQPPRRRAPARPRRVPVRRTALLRQRAHVPRPGRAARIRRAGARMDPRRGGAHHRRRHDGGRHAARISTRR